MPQRYEFDAIAGTFVEFGDSWSRGEYLQLEKLKGAPFYAFIQSKLTEMSLPLVNGEMLTDCTQFVEKLDDFDMQLFHWFPMLLALEQTRIGRLGESTGRQWLKSYVQTQEATTLTAPSSR